MSAVDQMDPSSLPARAAPRLPWRSRLAGLVRRFALATLAGLVLAGIVHIVTVLLIPQVSEHDAAAAYATLGTGGKAELLPTGAGQPDLRDADPATVTAVCSYDLSAGPMRVVARTGSLPLGLSLHRRGGGVVYAITERAAIRGTLEFVVMTEAQHDDRLAQDDEGETNRELRVVSDTEQGLIVARVLMERPSDRTEAEALATGVACGLAD
ncbi:hypothetical protein DWF00_04470 [Bosea caraganae]|uniref:DUF1254 domain-containing protein n=1 Tax=Bosea caraganae TaxID=2763117 RepID=A0A370KZZ4_9HYPH|nr:hypothetical protein [Bosea caraganae]RDJ20426.1 hypothetical protein DWE98_24180 [Bosea caraganae]RDJ29942.1 hypothetical protein DWF00_04470 [Bosea caraganae]